MTLKHVYGPIQSRRLGLSLGVDPIPLKTCNWNCIYCQLGRSVPMTNMRCDYVPVLDIMGEIKLALAREAALDWVTFVGSGEPTLHRHLGRLIRDTQALTSTPVAVITNGALFYLPEVRADLVTADAVLPTVCAGSADLYRHIHRPHPSVTFERHTRGLQAFRDEYDGKLWIGVMLLAGINDDDAALYAMGELIATMAPDRVHLLTPTRPPSETWVAAAGEDALMRAMAILGQVAPVEIPVGAVWHLDADDPCAAIEQIVGRHPLSDFQLDEALSVLPLRQAQAVRALLLEREHVRRVFRYGMWFWVSAAAHFPAPAAADL